MLGSGDADDDVIRRADARFRVDCDNQRRELGGISERRELDRRKGAG